MPFPLASPSEPSYRLPEYQARIDTYAMNYFLPAELGKLRSMGFKFVRGEADAIRHALIGEHRLAQKTGEFVASAYVYDLAHALLLQVQRTVQELVNVPQGLDVRTLLAVLYNLRGYKLVQSNLCARGAAGPVYGPNPGESSQGVQLKALSTSDYKTLLTNDDGFYAEGRYHRPVRVPTAETRPQETYPWSVTANGRIAIDGSIANIIEVCRSPVIPVAQFSMAQRANVFQPLGVDQGGIRSSQGGAYWRQEGRRYGDEASGGTFGYTGYNDDRVANPATGAWDVASIRNPNASAGTWGVGGANNNPVFTDYPGNQFRNRIREITLPAGQAFGPTSVAGLDEVFRMEQQRDQIIAMLTRWGTTGMGILLEDPVDYAAYRAGGDTRAVLGNRPAAAKFAQMNGMGNTCGPGYEALWFTGDPNDPNARAKPVRPFDERGVMNPQAQYSTCAPITRQLRNPAPTRDVMIDRTVPAYQRRAKRRAPVRRKKAVVRRRRR